MHRGLLVPAMGEGETRGDYDSGFGPHYGESGEEWGEIGRGGRWPDGEHIPIPTRHPPNQSLSYGLLHTRLTYHLRGGQRAGRGRGAAGQRRDSGAWSVGAWSMGVGADSGPAREQIIASHGTDPHHTGGRSTLLWAMTLDHEYHPISNTVSKM